MVAVSADATARMPALRYDPECRHHDGLSPKTKAAGHVNDGSLARLRCTELVAGRTRG